MMASHVSGLFTSASMSMSHRIARSSRRLEPRNWRTTTATEEARPNRLRTSFAPTTCVCSNSFGDHLFRDLVRRHAACDADNRFIAQGLVDCRF